MPNIVERLREYERRWNMRVGEPYATSPNYVAPARCQDGTEAVIKIGRPHDNEIRTEIAALQCYAGEGSARLLEADPENSVLLTEQLKPGTPLSDVEDDDEATRIIASVMKRLWRPLPADHCFPPIRDWAQGLRRYRTKFQESAAPIPLSHIDKAQNLIDELISTMPTPVLVHGDLHHGNVLRSQREIWLAIDPKGVAGEPAYEPAAMLRNPKRGLLARSQVGKLIVRRIHMLSDELGLDKQRILRWGIAQSVLSAVWVWEDHGTGWEYELAVAGKLLEVKIA